jgi:hypothetical protein
MLSNHTVPVPVPGTLPTVQSAQYNLDYYIPRRIISHVHHGIIILVFRPLYTTHNPRKFTIVSTLL